MFGNNYLKQLAFGARANSPAPICRSSNYYNSECSRCARRIMLFLKVVMVVSKCQYVWVKKRCALGSGLCAGGRCVVGCGWTCPCSGKRRSRRFGGRQAARRDASPHPGGDSAGGDGTPWVGGRLGGGNGSSLFFIQAYRDLETTKTTFKNNIILRTHLEHSES